MEPANCREASECRRPRWEAATLKPISGLEKLAAILFARVVLLIAVSGASVFRTSGQHNVLARENAERMVHGGIVSLEQRFDTVISDAESAVD